MNTNSDTSPAAQDDDFSPAEQAALAANVLALAWGQRALARWLVVKFALDFAVYPARLWLPGWALLAFFLVFAGVHVALARQAWRVGQAVHGGGRGALYASLSLVPCLGALGLLLLIEDARERLALLGLKVGFFGVNRRQAAKLAARWGG